MIRLETEHKIVILQSVTRSSLKSEGQCLPEVSIDINVLAANGMIEAPDGVFQAPHALQCDSPIAMNNGVVGGSANDGVVEGQRFGEAALTMMFDRALKQRGYLRVIIGRRQARNPRTFKQSRQIFGSVRYL